MWLSLKFFLLATELSVIVFGFMFGEWYNSAFTLQWFDALFGPQEEHLFCKNLLQQFQKVLFGGGAF